MKRMLINATQEEELRMAMVDGQRLYDLNIEAPASERKKANIYKGKITRIEPSLEAAFVDYGAERHGFLPFKEISSEYFVKEHKGSGKPGIRDVMKEGQDIVVQIDKEERGNKGAALTTYVSLAGRFIVLKPNKDRSGGVSRRITGADRDLARRSLNEIQIPDNMSVILRTAGIERSAEELAWDLENLLTVWTAILNVVLERPSPFLIYRESDSVIRALRDYLTNDIGEILIDDEATYKVASEHVEQTMPHNLKKLKHYDESVPLFTRFQIESQIESAFAHNVTLPSGGSIVIDHTEALVSIDINSARATKGGDIEATALNTNLEAADEIARQLRIRDLGGLIVIDFIDMGPQKHQREVENRLREAVRQDRARVQIGKISRFGLLEMSRQRLRPSIGDSAYQTCPRCTGFGTIRGTESLALAILRIIGEEVRKERTSKVIAQLPVEVATYLLNEKRDWVQNLEEVNATQVVLVANPHMETPHYDVRRVRDDQLDLPENSGVSYALADAPTEPESPQAILERKGVEAAAVGTLKPTKPAPKRAEPESKGIIAKIVGLFGGGEEVEQKQPRQRRAASSKSGRGRRTGQQQSRKRGESRGNQPRKKQRKKTPQKQQNRNQKSKQAQGKQQKQTQQKQAQQKTDEAKNEQKRTRSRRGRGGRRRRGRGAEKSGEGNDQQQNLQQSNKQDASKPVAEKPAKEERQQTAQKSQPGKDTAKRQPAKSESKPGTAESAPEKAKPPARSAEPNKEARKDAPGPNAKDGDKGKPRAAKPQKQGSDTPAAAKPESKGGDAKAKPASPKPRQPAPAKSVDTKPTEPKPSKDPGQASGPPRVRTDEERASAARKLNDTASQKIAKVGASAAPKKPATDAQPKSGNAQNKERKQESAPKDPQPADARPQSRLLPWDSNE